MMEYFGGSLFEMDYSKSNTKSLLIYKEVTSEKGWYRYKNWKSIYCRMIGNYNILRNKSLYETFLDSKCLREEHDYTFELDERKERITSAFLKIVSKYLNPLSYQTLVLIGNDHLTEYFSEELEGPAIIVAEFPKKGDIHNGNDSLYWSITLYNPRDVLKAKLILGQAKDIKFTINR